MENDNQNSMGGFHVYVNSPGNQIAQSITNTFNGPVYYGSSPAEQNGYTDEQISRALKACIGNNKVIDLKWKWAGAYWFLRWAAGYPVDVQAFCERINALGISIPDDFACSYENIRKYASLSFMSQDARNMNAVKPSKMDQDVFLKCREVVLKISEELAKNATLQM